MTTTSAILANEEVGQVKNLFDAASVREVQQRLALLRPDSQRQWGKMTLPQTMKHCSLGFQTADGTLKLRRIFLGRLIGGWIKPKVVADNLPIRKNSPTDKSLIVDGECNLEKEREELAQRIDRFAASGAAGCTTHPHFFFGPMTPDEWAILMYKHMDNHLRQFGV